MFQVENENLASPKYGAQVISGQNTSWLLSDSDNTNVSEQIAFHWLGDKNGITIKLGKPVQANHIQIRLLNGEYS